MKKKLQVGRPNQKTKIDKREIGTEIDVKIGYASAAAEQISGDAVISCGLPSGSHALILSDGMGKGIKAAAGSRLVVNRLRKNLKEGIPVARSIKEVNEYMIEHASLSGQRDNEATKDESFATVDLTVIDRKLCRAKFYKMGAATSFIVRGNHVRRIAKAALPVGIIPTLKLTHISAELKSGDIIVMVSDGITDADRNDLEAGWLTKYLSKYVENVRNIPNRPPEYVETVDNIADNTYYQQFKSAAAADTTDVNSLSPRILASDILHEAQQRYGNRERDDLTVAVAIITDSGNK